MTLAKTPILVDLGTQKPNKTIVKIPSLDYQTIHFVEGRWRVKIPKIATDQKFGHKLCYWLEKNKSITSARINQAASSLILEYEPQLINFSELENTLQNLLTRKDWIDFSLPEQIDQGKLDIYWERLGIPIASLGLALIALPWELPPLLVGGLLLAASWPAYVRAWEGINQEKQLTIDFLDALVISMNLSQAQFIAPAFMVSMIEGGEVIRDATARSSERKTLDLLDSLSQYVWIERDSQEIKIPLKQVQNGDLVVVYPGDLVPVDGKIIRGSGLLDQNKLTGESVPVHKEIEDEVFASTLLVEGNLVVQVERTGKDTRAGLVVELVKSAPVYDTRMENYAAKFANSAVVPTLLIGGGIYGLTGDLARTIGILTLDFGTGIRVSVPTTILTGLTQSARNGVYIRSGRAIEMLSRVDCVVFDKTGTLTQGKASIVKIESIDPNITEQEILTLAASAEKGLTHPIAQAIVQGAEDRGINIQQCQTWDYKVGLGVVATIEDKRVLVGSSRLMESESIDISAASSFKNGGNSLAYVARDGQLIGLILYADPIRKESRQVIEKLHELGIETHMLTGDIARVAHAVASELNIDHVHAQAFPETKVEVVKQLKAKGKTVAFIGDGINDSAALAYADLSLSFANGSDIARETADIVLMDDSLSGIIYGLKIAKDVMEIIYQNALIVAIPNLGALIAGVFFTLDPIIAIIINNGSAIAAGLNGLRPALISSEIEIAKSNEKAFATLP
jgi:magnesium-transporting ATPase (P-type)